MEAYACLLHSCPRPNPTVVDTTTTLRSGPMHELMTSVCGRMGSRSSALVARVKSRLRKGVRIATGPNPVQRDHRECVVDNMSVHVHVCIYCTCMDITVFMMYHSIHI